jgi:hypothetical protein
VLYLDIIKVFLPTYVQMNCLKNNFKIYVNPLNSELNPICHFLALLGAHHILHVSRIRITIDIKTAPTRFGAITIIKERTI